jgi:DNA-binding MurR/RpiR family transcriptional regulator
MSSPSFAGTKIGVLVRLAAIERDLRESERKIGDYLQQHAPEVVHLSITELADVTGTSEATVIRFARRLGYGGFSAFKIALALELHESATPMPGEVDLGDDVGTIKRKVLDSTIGGIRDTGDLLDDQSLSRAVEAIDGARRVEAYGVGSSAAVAHDMYAQLVQIGVPMVAVTDPHLQLLSAVQLQAGDVAFGISNSGSTKDTVEALEAAKGAGATTICLTRHARSPITKVSDIVLLASARSRMLDGLELMDRVAQVAVVDVLWVALAIRRGPDSRAALARGRQALTDKWF